MAGLALAPALLARAQTQKPAPPAALDPKLLAALGKSPYVYVSPLLASGAESTCHGEVWYGWIGGAAVVITATTTWKARSLARGLGQARLWVGDHGRWKQMLGGRDEGFRTAPGFVARAEQSKDAKLLDELLALYDVKYPKEIASWRDKMRAGFADGSRVLIRYVPEAPAGGKGAART